MKAVLFDGRSAREMMLPGPVPQRVVLPTCDTRHRPGPDVVFDLDGVTDRVAYYVAPGVLKPACPRRGSGVQLIRVLTREAYEALGEAGLVSVAPAVGGRDVVRCEACGEGLEIEVVSRTVTESTSRWSGRLVRVMWTAVSRGHRPPA